MTSVETQLVSRKSWATHEICQLTFGWNFQRALHGCRRSKIFRDAPRCSKKPRATLSCAKPETQWRKSSHCFNPMFQASSSIEINQKKSYETSSYQLHQCSIFYINTLWWFNIAIENHIFVVGKSTVNGQCLPESNSDDPSTLAVTKMFASKIHIWGFPRMSNPQIMHFTIWLFNIAIENPRTKWWFIAGEIIYFYGPWLPWLC